MWALDLSPAAGRVKGAVADPPAKSGAVRHPTTPPPPPQGAGTSPSRLTMRSLARFLAAGCGCGYAPVAAGTVASAVAAVIGAGLLAWSPLALAAAAVLASAGGYAAVRMAVAEGDPGWVVIDEFAGQFLALLALPQVTPVGVLLGFLLFRLFDITKLGPVGWADRQHGAFGVMADDVIAGLLAAALLLALRLAWPSLIG